MQGHLPCDSNQQQHRRLCHRGRSEVAGANETEARRELLLPDADTPPAR